MSTPLRAALINTTAPPTSQILPTCTRFSRILAQKPEGGPKRYLASTHNLYVYSMYPIFPACMRPITLRIPIAQSFASIFPSLPFPPLAALPRASICPASLSSSFSAHGQLALLLLPNVHLFFLFNRLFSPNLVYLIEKKNGRDARVDAAKQHSPHTLSYCTHPPHWSRAFCHLPGAPFAGKRTPNTTRPSPPPPPPHRPLPDSHVATQRICVSGFILIVALLTSTLF